MRARPDILMVPPRVATTTTITTLQSFSLAKLEQMLAWRVTNYLIEKEKLFLLLSFD